MNSKHYVSTVCAVVFSGILAGLAISTGAKAVAEPPQIPTPTQAEWRQFQASSLSTLKDHWNREKSKPGFFTDWSWQWKLAWLKKCAGLGEGEFCREVILTGLRDKALVVRAEAATIMGQRFEGSGDQALIAELSMSFKNPRNLRQNRPLFIQYRILFAIHQIGGSEAEKRGQELASSHPQTMNYWQKL
jgi:hypothetical protein